MGIMQYGSRKPSSWLAVVLIAAASLGLIAWAVWPKGAATPAWVGEYDVEARPPESIAPGTVIGQTAPAGWSHLVIKSLPRVRPGAEANLPWLGRSRTVRMASWMFTAFVADVRPETHGAETTHRLRAIALGLGTSSQGRDVIITPETAPTYGVELDWITREILTKGYATQRLAIVVVHGPTMAIVDTPVWYRSEGKHQLVRFRYALLVETATGRLESLVWLLDEKGSCGDGMVAILAPDTIDEAELVPDPREFNALGIPSDGAFAVDRLPPSRARALLPTDLRALAVQGKYTAAEARSLEQHLRHMLAQNQ
jgi:hypothetical protein